MAVLFMGKKATRRSIVTGNAGWFPSPKQYGRRLTPEISAQRGPQALQLDLLGLLVGELLPRAVQHRGRRLADERLVRESRLRTGDVFGESLKLLREPDLLGGRIALELLDQVPRTVGRHDSGRVGRHGAAHDGGGPG